MKSFQLDPFQEKAIKAINNNHSVFVSAPTGAGKTLIAEYAIEKSLENNKRVIYTAPIKAISNQKFREFNTQYPGRVGIITGDISIEPQAPILIMTTEIYRNQLLEETSQHEDTSWVIFDEVHYIDSYDRGTVWEEAIMFSLPQTRFVALSATAPNIEEIAHWIQSIHQHPIEVVLENKRPVELLHHFQCQNRVITSLPLLKKKGYLGRNDWARQNSGRFRGRHSRQKKYWKNALRAKANRIDELIKYLIDENRLPCLYFAFGRKRVEELAEAHMRFELLDEKEKEKNEKLFDELSKYHSLDKEPSAHKMKKLIINGIAFHHAGLLPTLKEVVEQLFTKKRIPLIFTTETFALGINMPARTVVFDELRKFYGYGFDNLTSRDYYQMAGRAGRRGLDTVGYVYSRVNPHYIPLEHVQKMIQGPQEPIRSQLNASYATLLNLYKKLGNSLLDIYPKSLHYYQSNKKKHKRAKLSIERKLHLLQSLNYIDDSNITQKGEFASWMYGYELVLSELWEKDMLTNLSSTELCVLLAALVYEPRKNERSPRIPGRFKNIEKMCELITKKIQSAEKQNHIYPPTKRPYFHLAKAIEAWVFGCSFPELDEYTDIDEGIIIRYFRMVIQLLRQLRIDPNTPDSLKKTIKETLPKINRDIVDAEKLLREDDSYSEQSSDEQDLGTESSS